mmetsp:Transcript_18621/g.56062  ORF Transcript_18621/g.56062 Transcript_18621/m.56062 type:complete len:96 (-) Transcript_18621:125-412(-)
MSRSAADMHRTAAYPTVASGAATAAAALPGPSNAGAAVWPWLPAGGGLLDTAVRAEDPPDVATRDRKALEGILAELRKEVDRLDEDAWMFKKLPF